MTTRPWAAARTSFPSGENPTEFTYPSGSRIRPSSFAAGDLPDARRAVTRPGEKQLSVRREGEGDHPVVVRFDLLQKSFLLPVPDRDVVGRVAGGEQPVVPTQSDRQRAVAEQLRLGAAGSCVEHMIGGFP